MSEPLNSSPTIPEQPEAKPPLRKSTPIVIALVAIVAVIGVANISNLVKGNKNSEIGSAIPVRPSAANAQQVTSFEMQQQLQAKRDADERQHQEELAAALQQLQEGQGVPGPEAGNAPPMTAAQRAVIYGDSPNAPQQTSNVSQAQAEAKQRELAREKQHQDALNSDTVAIDFPPQAAMKERNEGSPLQLAGETISAPSQPTAATSDIATAGEIAQRSLSALRGPRPVESTVTDQEAVTKEPKTDQMSYDFDEYQGRLYRVFEGTVLEAVVTNHVDGGSSGPVLLMLTTDYYSHDHQQLLMPQGTRLIGTASSVASGQQRKLFVSFHRAVCPDGFSLDFDKYVGLDQIGTTGLATKVDHGYLMAFGAAAAIGGLGGLAQIGNGNSILDPSTQIRNGISAQSSQEAEQILNHFLNRLPVITLKEGSRARVYIGRDILIPSYAEHRVNPTL
jgi:type IV secretory pathway VirB10-like protein